MYHLWVVFALVFEALGLHLQLPDTKHLGVLFSKLGCSDRGKRPGDDGAHSGGTVCPGDGRHDDLSRRVWVCWK